jgi:hypothetical protein
MSGKCVTLRNPAQNGHRTGNEPKAEFNYYFIITKRTPKKIPQSAQNRHFVMPNVPTAGKML